MKKAEEILEKYTKEAKKGGGIYVPDFWYINAMEEYAKQFQSPISITDEERKKQWYIKLLSKLMRIKHGTHLSLDEYIEEVRVQIYNPK